MFDYFPVFQVLFLIFSIFLVLWLLFAPYRLAKRAVKAFEKIADKYEP